MSELGEHENEIAIADVLNDALKLGLGSSWSRATVAKGVELKAGKPNVDRENGIIYGYAVATKGPALGHNMDVDDKTLDQVVELGNKAKAGIKSRFDHPSASSTSMGTFLGRSRNFRRDGDLVRADLHLSESAKEAPQGDLYSYILSLAENDPAAFGASMVFSGKSEQLLENDGTPAKDKNGNPLPKLARVEKLYASDIVDDPAANPGGMFSHDSLAEKVSAFLNRWAEHDLRPMFNQFAEVVSAQVMKGVLAMAEESKVNEQKVKDEAYAAGVNAERARVKGIQEKFAAVYGDKAGADDRAVCEQVVELGASIEEAEKTFKLRKLAQVTVAAPPSAGGSVETVPAEALAAEADLSLDERCKKEWERNASLREEFGALSTYVSFKESQEKGLSKIYQKK